MLCKWHWIFILYKPPHTPNWKGELQFKSMHSKLKWQNSRHKILLRGPWSFSVRESLLGVSNILLKWNTYKSGKKEFKRDLDRAHIRSLEKSVLPAVQINSSRIHASTAYFDVERDVKSPQKSFVVREKMRSDLRFTERTTSMLGLECVAFQNYTIIAECT